MDLLPSSHTEFSTPDYWDRFFKKRGQIPFEWYGEYPELHGVIHKYISPSNKVLVIGCGNSALSENMYDNGLQHLTNIDVSDVVIRQMTDRHKVKRPNMVFEQVDVTQMTYPDGSFNVALDKGTLDALLVSEEADVVKTVHSMFAQVCRCLSVGGRYIIVSLLQDHVQRVLLEYFTQLGWPVRIHRIQMEAEGKVEKSSPSMPVFAIVLTKLRPMPNMPQIVEVCRFEERIDRLEDVKYLSSIIKDMQYYHIVRQQLSQRLPTDQQVSLELHSSNSQEPRYCLTVVDSPNILPNKFAIFIVPQGRETEWLFSTDKGRLHLQDSACYQRLVVITLNRGHEYENLDAIKAELSNKVMELAPPHCPPRSQVPFLSIGEDIGKRYPVAEGKSESTGAYLVEDVEMNGGQLFRRLVFLSLKNVVQSEARLVEARKKKKKRRQPKEREGPPGKLKIDKGYLSCDYLAPVVGGLGLLANWGTFSEQNPMSCVLVGLGGGGFPSFIQGAFPEVVVDAVELDPSVVDIASHWFDLQPDDKLRIHVADGLQFIRDLVAKGERRDLVVIDVDSKDASIGLNCPPEAFVETEFLQTVAQLVSDEGLATLNLASRDEGIKAEIQARLKTVFPWIVCLDLEEDINSILFLSARPFHWAVDGGGGDGESLPPHLVPVFANMDARIKSVWPDTNVELSEVMTSLRMLT